MDNFRAWAEEAKRLEASASIPFVPSALFLQSTINANQRVNKMKTRNGKVARLPLEIREDLNHRLPENVPAKDILVWLDADPTVTKVLGALFEGRAISEQCTARKRLCFPCRGAPFAWRQEPQNVSEWRQGGYEEWLTYHSFLGNVVDLSENAARVALTGINAEHLLLVLTAAFADLLHNQGATDEIAFNRRLIVLQHLTKTALSMRRSEQKDARLQLDRERLELLRQRNPDKSPSSSPPSSETSKSSRSTPGSDHRDPESHHSIPTNPHPCHIKTPEIRRSPVPSDDPTPVGYNEPQANGVKDIAEQNRFD